jgi:hypothetical protein
MSSASRQRSERVMLLRHPRVAQQTNRIRWRKAGRLAATPAGCADPRAPLTGVAGELRLRARAPSRCFLADLNEGRKFTNGRTVVYRRERSQPPAARYTMVNQGFVLLLDEALIFCERARSA